MTGVVRPVRVRVVRQEVAARTVSRMLDALPPSERPAGHADRPTTPAALDPEAYDDGDPALFVYRLRRGDQAHVGIVAEVGAEGFRDGRVRGHEAVQPERVAGLVDHFTSTAVRTELVALLHPGGPAVEMAVAASLAAPPLLQFTGPDDWEQTVWRLPPSCHEEVCAELGEGVHYVADGHHRVAASLEVWRRTGRPSGLMAVIYGMDGLRLLAFHRRVVGPVDRAGLLTLLARSFDVRPIDGPDEATGCFAVHVDGRWYDAAYRYERRPGAAGLDVTILDEQVLGPLLGAGPDRTARLEIAPALTDLSELTAACDRDGGALFALRPTTLDQLVEVADRGEVMPPKTTYFDPKPYAGIFLH